MTKGKRIIKKMQESTDAFGYKTNSTSSMEECGCEGGICMGNVVGAQNAVGIDNVSRMGTMIQRGVKKKRTRAGDILRGLKIMEAEEDTGDDKKVVAQVVQDVTAGDLKNASKAAKLLADAGKLDKATADKISQAMNSIK